MPARTTPRPRRVARAVKPASFVLEPLQLAGADVFAEGAQRGDERRDLARGALEPVTLELGGEDLAHPADLAAAQLGGTLPRSP